MLGMMLVMDSSRKLSRNVQSALGFRPGNLSLGDFSREENSDGMKTEESEGRGREKSVDGFDTLYKDTHHFLQGHAQKFLSSAK